MELRLVRHDTVDSTSERAFEALEAGGARNGDVHLARAQTRGRGRLGRRWESARDEGLYASVVLLPEPPQPGSALLSMAAGLAVRDGVSRLGLAETRLDWPNDLCVGEAKVAGVLIESRGLDPSCPHFVIGLGLNVLQSQFGPELTAERPVTSLALEGVEASLADATDAVLGALVERLAQLDADPEGLTGDYARALGLVGEPVEVQAGGGFWSGRLEGISLPAGLELALEAGRVAHVPLETVKRLARH